jgi:hypothetical protein
MYTDPENRIKKRFFIKIKIVKINSKISIDNSKIKYITNIQKFARQVMMEII